MILTIFLTLFAVSLAFIFLGFYSQMDAFKIIGFTIIFLLGLVLLSGFLEVQNGKIINNVGNATLAVYNVTSTEVNTYSNYSNHTISFLICIAGIVGFIFTMVDRRSRIKW